MGYMCIVQDGAGCPDRVRKTSWRFPTFRRLEPFTTTSLQDKRII